LKFNTRQPKTALDILGRFFEVIKPEYQPSSMFGAYLPVGADDEVAVGMASNGAGQQQKQALL